METDCRIGVDLFASIPMAVVWILQKPANVC
jgi:hypothetical protein